MIFHTYELINKTNKKQKKYDFFSVGNQRFDFLPTIIPDFAPVCPAKLYIQVFFLHPLYQDS